LLNDTNNKVVLFCIAAPDPPSNLSVNVRSGKSAQVSWSPPPLGHYSSFKLKVKNWVLCWHAPVLMSPLFL